MVVVITGNIADENFVIPQKMIREYLIPAVEDWSNQPVVDL